MERSELKPVLEAMLFVAEEPLEERKLFTTFEESGISRENLQECLEEITRDYNENPERGIQLVEVAGGYQLRTKETCAPWLMKLNVPKPVKLSPAALETLAIIAYRQPCIRSEIESIRGVDAGGVIKTLLERRLVRIVGRRDEAGQPLIYGTTREFLELFNLKDLNELPPLKDIEEFMRERKVLTEEAQVRFELDAEAAQDRNAEGEEIPFAEEVQVDETVQYESDEEALSTLEASLKDLRQIEKSLLVEALVPEGEADEADSAAETDRSSD